MPIELQKDTLLVDQRIAQESAQAMVEGDILVPDIKPDISRILSIEGKMELLKKEVVDHSINVEGQIKFKILYVSDKGIEPLYSIDSSTVFKQEIPIQGIYAKMHAEVEGELEHITYTIAHERKISVKAVVSLLGTVFETISQTIVSEVTGLTDIQVLKEQVRYTELVGEGSGETLVKESFELDETEAPIREILKWNGMAVEREIKVSDQKVIAGAALLVEILYLSDEMETGLYVLKKEIPFTHFIDVPKIKSHMDYSIRFTIDEIYLEVKENIQGQRKLLEVEAVAKSLVKVSDSQVKEMVVDAYSPTHLLKANKQLVNYQESIGNGNTHIMIREVLDIPSTYPPIGQIFTVQAKPLLTGRYVTDDKVIIEGLLEATVNYAAEDGQQPFYSFVQQIPFRNYAELTGLKEGMESNVELFLEEVTYQQGNSVQVDIKASVSALWEVHAQNYVEALHSVEELEGVKQSPLERPSLTVYFMQPDDTLWQIAKKYDTTVTKILESNQLEVPEELKAGDYLLIEKVHHV